MLLSIVTLVKNRDRAKMTFSPQGSRGHPALARCARSREVRSCHAPPFGLDAPRDRLHSCVMCGSKGTAHRRRADSWPTFRHWRYRQGRIESERHGHPGRKISMIPFISSRTSTWRLLPPRLAGKNIGSTCAHSSSVTSLRYRNLRRSQRPRFFAVAIVEPPRIKPLLLNHKQFKGSKIFSNRHLGAESGRNFHTILHLHVIRKKYINYINKLCYAQPDLEPLGLRSCGFDSRRPRQRFREAAMQGAGARVSPAFKKKATRRVFAAP